MKKLILILIFFVVSVQPQSLYSINKVIEEYATKNEISRQLNIFTSASEGIELDLGIFNDIKQELGKPENKFISFDPNGRFIRISFEGSGQSEYTLVDTLKYRFFFTKGDVNEEVIINPDNIKDVVYLRAINPLDKADKSKDLNFFRLFPIKEKLDKQYEAIKYIAFAFLKNKEFISKKIDKSETEVKDTYIEKYFSDKRVNDAIGFFPADSTEDLFIDFSLPTRFAASTIVKNYFFGSESNEPFLIGLDIDKNEKLMNVQADQNNTYKVGMRFIIPGVKDYIDSWGIDLRFYYRMKFKNQWSVPQNDKILLNFTEGVVVDVNYYSSPIFLNVYFATSTKRTITDPALELHRWNFYESYFTLTEYMVSNSFYWDFLNKLHKMKLNLGIGGFDVWAFDRFDDGTTSNRKMSNIVVLPLAEFQYYMTNHSNNNLLGLSARFFDGHLRLGGWIQPLRITPSSPDAFMKEFVFRIEANYITKRIAGTSKIWDVPGGSSITGRFRFTF